MKERPILFSAPMVRALLAGTKTQTRRVIKPRHLAFFNQDAAAMLSDWNERPLPYGKTGDRLWVRESHWWFKDDHETGYFPPTLTIDDVAYRADGEDPRKVWRPSIHMPRWASRITLEITSVRVERLQDISEADAMAEGIVNAGDDNGYQLADTSHYAGTASESYASLWESINGPGSWGANPWVWCVSFKRLEAA